MNKPSFEALQRTSFNSFLLRSFKETAFSGPYHFHPEYELTLILKGKGKRFIGNHMADYISGDLVLVGPNLPHCWKTEDITLGEINAHSIVIQFSGDFLGTHFFDKPELINIYHLLQKAVNGIQFTSETQTIVKEMMMTLAEEKSNFKQLISLLEILQILATSNYFYLLSENNKIIRHPLADQERINPVLAYLIENFRKSISLSDAAGIANMSPNAFCRYFKKITRKTFMETVIDYRINHATQQLIQTNRPISEICFDSGFTDVSHFYKIFRSKMKLSPLSYRNKFRKSV